LLYDTPSRPGGSHRDRTGAWCASVTHQITSDLSSPLYSVDRKLPARRAAPLHARRRAAVLVPLARGAAPDVAFVEVSAASSPGGSVGNAQAGSAVVRARGMVYQDREGCGTPNRLRLFPPSGTTRSSWRDRREGPLRARDALIRRCMESFGTLRGIARGVTGQILRDLTSRPQSVILPCASNTESRAATPPVESGVSCALHFNPSGGVPFFPLARWKRPSPARRSST